ncbi:MAG: CDP-glucose 4,6-dehydratase [Verrucomicrobia bacterium]|nr:CDP-glucose 4,6-dehydratase [Verrucomicrobiota bacterium]
MFDNAFKAKTVWCSGTTGFKGAWLAHWLVELGARVHGFALPPPTTPSVFEQTGLAGRITQEHADLRDARAVQDSLAAVQPDVVFHLAAQSLVRTAFDEPLSTYATNVMGTAHVLEGLRRLEKPCVAVLITTDKCYENREWCHGYREEDPLGGFDPYSSSKACAEIAIASWRRSFFGQHPVRIASARAGNVIGGGDWAKDRLVPDCIRALQARQPVPVRHPASTRPWQHVLEPLSGYLWLAAVLSRPALRPYERSLFASAFNFGPSLESNRTAAELVTEVLKHWRGRWEDKSDPNAVHEATLLHLACDKAFHLLGWKPVWTFERAVAATMAWYRQATAAKRPAARRETLRALISRQIRDYQRDAAQAGLPWASPAHVP